MSHSTSNDSSDWDHSSRDEFYNYYAQESLSEETYERSVALRDTLLRFIDRDRAERPLDVADIGCAAGAQCQRWAELGHRVRGLDINEPLLELARRRATEAGLSIEFEVGTATQLPWPSSSVDVCLAPELLEHVADWPKCLDEFSRVLRPGGILYISTSNRLCPVQEEFNLPLYSWYPARLKHHYERLAMSTRPDIANYATYPAVNWFTFYSLSRAMARRSFDAHDRFDLMDLRERGTIARAVVRLIRAVPPLRWLGHVATPYTVVVAIRR